MPAEWKYSQSFSVGQTGLVKVAIPLSTLTSCRPGWPDLRLIEAASNQVPFVIERNAPPVPFSESASFFQSRIENETTVVRFATERQNAPEAVDLETPEPQFLKAVLFEASADGRLWQTIARGVPLFVRAGGQRQLRLPLPNGQWHHFRLTIDDRRSAPIPFTGARLYFASAVGVPSEPLPVEMLERTEEPGRTRVNLRLGGANLVLDSLTIETPEPLFSRAVLLAKPFFTAGEAHETTISSGLVYRLDSGTNRAAPKLSVANGLTVDSQQLSLVIENLDNPPLALVGLTARFRTVYLVFNVATLGVYSLLSGNPDCPVPRYDLAEMQGGLRGASILPVVPGPLTENPAYQRVDKLAMIDALGAPMDPALWHFRKLIPLASAGVHQVELDLDVLAHASQGFGDLRIVQQGLQIPYILDRTPILRSVTPTVTLADEPKRSNVSRWKLAMTNVGPWFSSLTATSSTPYFRREVRVTAARIDQFGNSYQDTLGSVMWTRLPEDKSALLRLSLSPTTVTNAVFLEIENGDNPPLKLDDIRMWWQTSRLVFKTKPSESLALYYGNPEVNPPRYDLDLLGPRLIAADKTSPRLSAEEILKPIAKSEAFNPAGWPFWSVLGLVVVALLVVISRLLPR